MFLSLFQTIPDFFLRFYELGPKQFVSIYDRISRQL